MNWIKASTSVLSDACEFGGTAATNSAAKSGTGTNFERIFCGKVLTSAITFSLSSPGTSHSQRAAGIWLSCASGSVSVTPSRGVPGSK